MTKPLSLIPFEKQPWESVKDGLKQKSYTFKGRRLRILLLGETFKEESWCLNGHVGFVLKGHMRINFNGTVAEYTAGDGLWIEEGEESKHKVMIEKDHEVELLLFENILE